MSKVSMEIWGRSFEIPIIYDCYTGEEILNSQKEAYQMFMEKSGNLLEVAKEEIKKYCLKVNKDEIDDKTMPNIFRYVIPKSLFIKRCNNEERTVAILCAYKFNPDDGIAVVFRNEAFSEIGTENIIL